MQAAETTYYNNQGRHFICFSKEHVSRTYKANYSCVKFKYVSICLAKEDKRKTNADENVTDASTPLQMNCKLVTLLRQQLFHIQQKRILKF